MYDERSLRPMSPTPRQPAHRRRILRFLVLQPGPKSRFRRFQKPKRPPNRKLDTGKTLKHVARQNLQNLRTGKAKEFGKREKYSKY